MYLRASDNSDKAGAAAPLPKKPHFHDYYIALGKLDSKVLETALGSMPLELLQYVALHVCDLYVAYKAYGGEDRHRDYQTMEGVFVRMRNGNKAPETAELLLDLLYG
ncbi:hypothetical protein PG991_013914 [Apiospora marii]|uniref:Uncharacterized protein n=1 Tax=Apiospora marii TaxID=335849 RepID=A0ABR1R7D5_9PEZI